jgi:hypothetical protein
MKFPSPHVQVPTLYSMHCQFVYEDEPPCELLEFESIIVDMYNPLNRISVENALKNLLALLNRPLPQDHDIFNDPIISLVKRFTSLIMEENINILPEYVQE